MGLDVHEVTIPFSFKFGVEYEYNFNTQNYECWAVYKTKKDYWTIRNTARTKEEAEITCRHMIQHIWHHCVANIVPENAKRTEIDEPS